MWYEEGGKRGFWCVEREWSEKRIVKGKKVFDEFFEGEEDEAGPWMKPNTMGENFMQMMAYLKKKDLRRDTRGGFFWFCFSSFLVLRESPILFKSPIQ